MSEPDAPERRLFKRSGPFYPHLVNYCTTHIGHMVVATRGGCRHMEAWVRHESRNESLHPLIVRHMTADVNVPYPGVRLPSRVEGNGAMVEIDEVAFELFHSQDQVRPWSTIAAGSLLVLAWETTHRFHDNGPLWEFLYHCRNAVAHGGRFHFRKRQPRHPAVWRHLQLTDALQGTPLFDLEDTPGLLGSGDPIYLLYDIERAYPAMTASDGSAA